jgi:putative sigma-54 modulation protein
LTESGRLCSREWINGEVLIRFSSDVYLKVEKTSDKENKVVEIKMNVPGDDFMVKKQCKTFERLSYRLNLWRLLVRKRKKIRTHI